MFQIGDVLISDDVLGKRFLCDLSQCKGACCIEGDAGAPVEADEVKRLEDALPAVWDDLSAEARDVIRQQGLTYTDIDGQQVISIVNGRDCVFTCYDAKGMCLCALEKAFREHRIDFYKPISCHLYPIRVSQVGDMKALNYHEWSVCQGARLLGRKLNVRVYEFLREPLIRMFGQEWYDELCDAAEELRKRHYID